MHAYLFYRRKGCNTGIGFHPIYVNVNMKNGDMVNNWVDSLQASWAGVQVRCDAYMQIFRIFSGFFLFLIEKITLITVMNLMRKLFGIYYTALTLLTQVKIRIIFQEFA